MTAGDGVCRHAGVGCFCGVCRSGAFGGVSYLGVVTGGYLRQPQRGLLPEESEDEAVVSVKVVLLVDASGVLARLRRWMHQLLRRWLLSLLFVVLGILSVSCC